MRFRPLVAAVALPILGLSLAACGESAVQKYVKAAPTTVDQDMRTALNAMTSVHVHTVQSVSGTPFTLDISVDNAGRCVGSLAQGTQTLSLIGLGGSKIYAKGSADFWTAEEGVSTTAAAALAGKWVTGLPSGMFGNTCAITSLVKSFTANSVANDKAKVLGKTKVNGTDAVTLQITLSSSPVKIAVAASAPHRPLQVTAAGGKLVSVFSEFDKPVRPTAPAGATDVNKLAGAK